MGYLIAQTSRRGPPNPARTRRTEPPSRGPSMPCQPAWGRAASAGLGVVRGAAQPISAGAAARSAIVAVAGVVVRVRAECASSVASWRVTVRTPEHRLFEVAVSAHGRCLAVPTSLVWAHEQTEGV